MAALPCTTPQQASPRVSGHGAHTPCAQFMRAKPSKRAALRCRQPSQRWVTPPPPPPRRPPYPVDPDPPHPTQPTRAPHPPIFCLSRSPGWWWDVQPGLCLHSTLHTTPTSSPSPLPTGAHVRPCGFAQHAPVCNSCRQHHESSLSTSRAMYSKAHVQSAECSGTPVHAGCCVRRPCWVNNGALVPAAAAASAASAASLRRLWPCGGASAAGSSAAAAPLAGTLGPDPAAAQPAAGGPWLGPAPP